MEEDLVKQLSEQENVTERLKTTDTMAWVRKINSIRAKVNEIIRCNLIEC